MLFKEVFVVATLILCLLEVNLCHNQDEDEQILIVLSLDAFRPDFFDRGFTPLLQLMRAYGARAPFMKPVFPTKTYTNHFSIATGLYAGTHGVQGNRMSDTVDGNLRYGAPLFHHMPLVTPIWTLNEIWMHHSACLGWPESNFEYLGRNCTYAKAYSNKTPKSEQLDIIISWLTQPKMRPNLVMWYMSEPDETGHVFGIHSDEVNQCELSPIHRYTDEDSLQFNHALKDIDNMMVDLLLRLEEHNLMDRVNIIVLSDHGMLDIPEHNIIDLTKFLKPGTYQIANNSPGLQITPGEGHEQEVFRNLSAAAAAPHSHFKVYNDKNVLDRWRIRNKRRFGPILAVAEPTYAFQDMTSLITFLRENKGAHSKCACIFAKIIHEHATHLPI